MIAPYYLTDHEITLIVVALAKQFDSLQHLGDVVELRELENRLRQARADHQAASEAFRAERRQYE